MENQVEELLRRQATIEIQASAQMALLSATVADESLSERFKAFSEEELEHFREVCLVAADLGVQLDLAHVDIKLVVDAVEAIVYLRALEETIRNYLNDLWSVLEEPHRSVIKHQEEQEKAHIEELHLLQTDTMLTASSDREQTIGRSHRRNTTRL